MPEEEVKNILLRGHTGAVTSARWLDGDDRVISVSHDGTIRFWDSSDGEQLDCIETLGSALNAVDVDWQDRYDHKHAVSTASMTGDGRLLATGSWDRTILLYDLQTGGYRLTGPEQLTGAHRGSITCSSITANGDLLVTGGMDKSVIVWDVPKREHVIYLKGHTEAVTSVSYATNEQQVLSASADMTVRLWDLSTRERMASAGLTDQFNRTIRRKCVTCEKKFTPMSPEELQGRAKCTFCRTVRENE